MSLMLCITGVSIISCYNCYTVFRLFRLHDNFHAIYFKIAQRYHTKGINEMQCVNFHLSCKRFGIKHILRGVWDTVCLRVALQLANPDICNTTF